MQTTIFAMDDRPAAVPAVHPELNPVHGHHPDPPCIGRTARACPCCNLNQ